MHQPNKLNAYLAYTSVCFFWGTTYLAIRIGVEVFPPALFAGLRFLAAGVLLLSGLLMLGHRLPALAEMRKMAITGISLLAIANGAVVWAEQFVPSGLAALIVATVPFWMVAIDARLPHGGKLTARKVAGMIIGFLGLIILLWPELRGSLDRSYLAGIVALFIAPLAWAGGSIYSKYCGLKTPPLMAAAIQMLIAGLVLILFGGLKGEFSLLSWTTQGMAALAYLVVFGSVVGYSSYIYALDKLPAAMLSTYAYINPIVAVVLGWLVLDERLDSLMLMAMAIILAGVVLVKTASSTKPDIKETRASKTESGAPCVPTAAD